MTNRKIELSNCAGWVGVPVVAELLADLVDVSEPVGEPTNGVAVGGVSNDSQVRVVGNRELFRFGACGDEELMASVDGARDRLLAYLRDEDSLATP